MEKYYPYFKSITPDDFLLNLINHQINQIMECHSKVLAFRMDFDYLRGSGRFIRNSLDEIQRDIRNLTQEVMNTPGVLGYFWVIEWTVQGAIHVHAIFYLNGQKHQKSFPFIRQIGELWQKITSNEGKYEYCKPKDYHKDNINRLVNYSNKDEVDSLRRIASYLAKESQKNSYLVWGYNEVPEPARQGRPRRLN
ncbi:rolling circle replication-associated protein [Dickeya chrysanthemi]|uniref:rolling circle replication-associated protein n=1 Tax=Dickeya chrysanthemi TaxID=556 RepID=UPI00301B2336